MNDYEKIKKELPSFHVSDIDEVNIFVDEKPDVVEKCIYCNEKWSEKMLRIYQQSGYCETCYDSREYIYIFCDKCGKLVYKKEV